MKATDYKKHSQKKQITEDVPLPSGAVFKMRLAPIQQWTTTGVLPASLAVKMETVAKAKNAAEANAVVLEHFTEQDFIDSQSVGRRMLEYCCIEPKVYIAKPGEPIRELTDDEILPEDILPEDFEAIMKWIWSGGKQGASLAKFSRTSRQPSKPRAHR